MNGAVTTGDELLVPGPAVRREYLKLPGDLAHLTGSFGITLPPQLHRHAAALAFSIECTDRLLDAIPQAQRRARFSADVVSCLRGEKFSNEDITPELAGWLARLSEVAERHGVSVRFREIIRELLSNSEEMRTTRNHARFVDCAVREGRWMVELLLLLLATSRLSARRNRRPADCVFSRAAALRNALARCSSRPRIRSQRAAGGVGCSLAVHRIDLV
ncbi:MAG: hypothetical protein DME22_26615 [Verrucomicrobia bacterium]|nr:MAG: hypothetical protein DME22_26615 [Verrucomicrobiota bacterium]